MQLPDIPAIFGEAFVSAAPQSAVLPPESPASPKSPLLRAERNKGLFGVQSGSARKGKTARSILQAIPAKI